MHVVLVSAFLCETPWDIPGGGMGEYVTKIARLLADEGNQVEIVAGASNNKIWAYKGITVYNAFWYGDIFGSVKQVSESIIKRNISIQKRIREINSINKIDIVQYAGWSGVGLFHSINCPSILRLSTYSKMVYSHNVQFKDYVDIYSFWERMAGRSVDRVICPGAKVAEVFGKEIGRKITIVETPVSVENVVRDRSVYETISGKSYLLFFGSASKEKGFEVIGDMCRELFHQNKDIIFVSAGWDEGTGKNSAVHRLKEKLASHSDRFVYLGPLNKNQLFPVIEGAEIVLIPSLVDNMPNACLEAMALGKIVIGTKGTALEQLIEDEKNGFLVEPNDADALLGKVNRILKMNKKDKERVSKNAQNDMLQYRPDYCVKKLMSLYKYEIRRKKKYGCKGLFFKH